MSTTTDNGVTVSQEATANPSLGLIGFLKSHPIGFWFIFWGEFAERCSYYGMRAILATYMANQLGFGQANANMFMSFFIAACYFLPLIGGYVADNYLGKYRTIVFFSLPYILGHVVLGIENSFCLFAALSLLAMGTGVIKPNISTLMGLTYDQQRPGQTLLRSQAFSMFYMSINIGAAISQLTIPVIKDRYGYAIAFLFPAALMVLAFILFAAGKRFYAVEVIERRRKTPQEKAEMWLTFRMIAGVFIMVVFFWAIFDQSASTWIFFGETYQINFSLPILGEMTPERIQSFNPILIVILLPFATYMWTKLKKQGVQVKDTSKLMAGFFLTMLCMAIMAWPAFKVGPLTSLYVPMKAEAIDLAKEQIEKQIPKTFDAASIVGHVSGPTFLPNALTAVYSPTLGKTPFVHEEQKVTLWWQALAYVLLTIAEIFISVTGLEMAFVVAPKSMKGFITSLWLLTVFMANALLNAPLGRLYPRMHPGIYFLMLTGMMIGVMIIFMFVARRYNRLAESIPSPSSAT